MLFDNVLVVAFICSSTKGSTFPEKNVRHLITLTSMKRC